MIHLSMPLFDCLVVSLFDRLGCSVPTLSRNFVLQGLYRALKCEFFSVQFTLWITSEIWLLSGHACDIMCRHSTDREVAIMMLMAYLSYMLSMVGVYDFYNRKNRQLLHFKMSGDTLVIIWDWYYIYKLYLFNVGLSSSFQQHAILTILLFGYFSCWIWVAFSLCSSVE